MRTAIHHLDLGLALVALALGVLSILLRDADKAPLYFLLAYVLLRLWKQ